MSSGAERIVVIGTGNRWRRDDGAGPAVAARLRDRGIDAIDHEGEASGLIDVWDGAALAIAIDAIGPGGAPGTVRRMDATEAALPADAGTASTHLFGLAQTIELARTLGRFPDRLIVYGIEGADFSTGEGLTPAVAATLDEVVAAVLAEIANSPRVDGG